MKKRISLIFAILLVALLGAALVACDPDPANPLGPESPSQSTYTVTFDLNGALFEYPDALAPITGVKYGDTIAEPLYEGKRIELQKKGYEFLGWTANNSDFVFGEGGTKIVSNTTIRAKFEAKKYYHIPNIYATVSYVDGSYVIDPDGHATPDAGSTDVLKNSLGEEVKDDKGNTIPVPATDITFKEGVIGENTSIYSTFNATTPSRIAVPSRLAPEGEEQDYFCFWFYMADTLDEDGKPVKDSSGATKQHPVQFSEWAKEGVSDVSVRSVTYTYDEPLTLYAMFESDLPFVTVEYYESEEEGAQPLNANRLNEGKDKYRLGKNIPDSEKFAPVLSETAAHGKGYDFDRWYFVYYTENEDEDGDQVRNVENFIFETFDESGNSTNSKDVTSPMDAAHDDKVPSAEQNFRPVTLKLYANWVKKIEIGSVSEYNALATKIQTRISALTALKEGDLGFEEAQKALDEYLTATLKFTADINFGGAELAPLFDAAHPFTGIIDGGKYTEGEEGEQVLDGRYTLSNATVEGESFSSLFGHVDGAVKNLTVNNITVRATSATDTLYLGALASVSGGSFANCVVSGITFSLPENAGLTYIGGLAGLLRGTANDADKGSISKCKVTISLSGLEAKGLYIGGLAGECESSTAIANCTADLTLVSVSATEVQGAASGLYIGGIAGFGVATVSACEASLTVTGDAISATGTALIGGLLGQNAGSISRSHATLTATALHLGSNAPLLAVGGFVGRNEGDIINSYADANIALTLTKDMTAYVGGLVGLNRAARTDSQSDKEKGPGAINRCYSSGPVSVTVDNAVTSAQVYVGGMIGFSKHSKFANNFTLANVTVSYTTAKDTSLIHAGFLFGQLDDATMTSGYYANDGKVTVNDKTYNGSEFAPKDEETDDSETDNSDKTEEQPNENGICTLGTPRPATDFATTDVVFGANSDEAKDNLGWAGGNEEDASKNIWELKEGATAPTLLDIGFPQESQEG